jgi:hypothetical protein
MAPGPHDARGYPLPALSPARPTASRGGTSWRAPGSAAPGRILDTPIVRNVAAPLTDATNY